jgi:hypothetical protein
MTSGRSRIAWVYVTSSRPPVAKAGPMSAACTAQTGPGNRDGGRTGSCRGGRRRAVDAEGDRITSWPRPAASTGGTTATATGERSATDGRCYPAEGREPLQPHVGPPRSARPYGRAHRPAGRWRRTGRLDVDLCISQVAAGSCSETLGPRPRRGGSGRSVSPTSSCETLNGYPYAATTADAAVASDVVLRRVPRGEGSAIVPPRPLAVPG